MSYLWLAKKKNRRGWTRPGGGSQDDGQAVGPAVVVVESLRCPDLVELAGIGVAARREA